jgi:hypothetical protein
LAAIAKLNGALCRALPASAATATLNGSNTSAEKLKAHVPNHCLTEPDFALDFIAHDLCRTHGMRMTRSFSHYTDGVWVYLIRILKLFYWNDVVFDLTPSSERRPEQARSHRFSAIQCGSEPARDGASSLNAK